jgi:hypothetical protein
VQPEELDIEELEASGMASHERGDFDRDEFSVRKDVSSTEPRAGRPEVRTELGRPAGLGDSVIEEAAARPDSLVRRPEVCGQVPRSDVFEHADRRDRVEGTKLEEVAIIAHLCPDQMPEPGLRRPPIRLVRLALGERDADPWGSDTPDSNHAARPWYSWMSPPSRSRHRTSRGLTGTGTLATPSGVARRMAR